MGRKHKLHHVVDCNENGTVFFNVALELAPGQISPGYHYPSPSLSGSEGPSCTTGHYEYQVSL